MRACVFVFVLVRSHAYLRQFHMRVRMCVRVCARMHLFSALVKPPALHSVRRCSRTTPSHASVAGTCSGARPQCALLTLQGPPLHDHLCSQSCLLWCSACCPTGGVPHVLCHGWGARRPAAKVGRSACCQGGAAPCWAGQRLDR